MGMRWDLHPPGWTRPALECLLDGLPQVGLPHRLACLRLPPSTLFVPTLPSSTRLYPPLMVGPCRPAPVPIRACRVAAVSALMLVCPHPGSGYAPVRGWPSPDCTPYPAGCFPSTPFGFEPSVHARATPSVPSPSKSQWALIITHSDAGAFHERPPRGCLSPPHAADDCRTLWPGGSAPECSCR